MCRKEKSFEFFDWRHKAKNIYQSYCKECRKQIDFKFYRANKDKIKKVKEKYLKEFKKQRNKIVNSFKNVPCFDCKVRYPPYVMDFDHLRDKKFSIADGKNSKSIDVLLEEIR